MRQVAAVLKTFGTALLSRAAALVTRLAVLDISCQHALWKLRRAWHNRDIKSQRTRRSRNT